MRRLTLLIATCCLVFASSVMARADNGPVEDWPKWLGPDGTGISRATNLADQWPQGGPKRLWSKKVGLGHSSPVAADGRVYLFHLAGNEDHLTCFQADSGKVVWDQSYRGGWTGPYKGTRATPLIEKDANRIYTYGGAGHLVCRELDTGKPVWAFDVLKSTGNRPLEWGQASSPLLVGNILYVQAGEGGPVAVAVDKHAGRPLWQSQARDKAGYAHIIQVDADGAPQLVVFAGKAVYGINPKDGKTLWREPWQTSYDVNAATPVYRENHLFVSSEYNHGCMMLKLDDKGAKKLWERKDVQLKFQPPILDGDHLYANSAGTLKCMSWPDGKLVWQATEKKMRVGPGGSMLRVGNKLITLSEQGKLSLVHAEPQGFKLLAQAELFDGSEIWSTPLLYDGKLYAKGQDEFVCLDVSRQ